MMDSTEIIEEHSDESAEESGVSSERGFSQLSAPVLDEVIRQFRATRNDILRYGVWNTRNLSDEDFNRIDDQRLFDYFRQDLLETRFLNKGRRADLLQGAIPLTIEGQGETYLEIQDRDLEKVRKRIADVASFMSILRSGDYDSFRKVKYKLRRTVMRLTYDLHHLYKRLEKHRKNVWANQDTRAPRVALETVAEIPEPPPLTGEVGEDTQA
jgi:hypothetical protein